MSTAIRSLIQLKYQLDFLVLAAKEDQTQVYEVLSFNFLSLEKGILLDFKESFDKLKTIILNSKSQEILLENEYTILPRE